MDGNNIMVRKLYLSIKSTSVVQNWMNFSLQSRAVYTDRAKHKHPGLESEREAMDKLIEHFFPLFCWAHLNWKLKSAQPWNRISVARTF